MPETPPPSPGPTAQGETVPTALAAQVAALGRRYAAISALRWFPIGLLVPVFIVLPTARGYPIAAIGPVAALYSALVVLLELPTGGLADRIGRRRVHLLASVFGLASFVLLAAAESLLVFGIAMIPAAVNRALMSGPLEAWFVDAANEVDPDADLTRPFASAESIAALALGAGALVTAALPQVVDLPAAGAGLIAPALPMWLAAVAEVVHLVGAWALMRPDSLAPTAPTAPFPAEGAVPALAEPAVPATIGATVKAALVTARGPVLRRLLVAEFVIALALVTAEQVVPVDLVAILGERDAATTYALLAAAGFVFVSAGAKASPWLAERLGPRHAYAFVVALVALATALPAVRASVIVLAVGFLAIYVSLGARSPLRATMLHARVTADRRATVLSVTSLVFQVGGLLAGLTLLPLFAGPGRTVAYLAPAVLIAVGAVVLSRPVPDEP